MSCIWYSKLNALRYRNMTRQRNIWTHNAILNIDTGHLRKGPAGSVFCALAKIVVTSFAHVEDLVSLLDFAKARDYPWLHAMQVVLRN